ncbi:MAG: carbohydrate ABC transporter permease [Anaerolineae bacterium]
MTGRVNWLKWLAIIFFLIPILFILVFPFIVMISTSFKSLEEVNQIPPTFIPREPTLDNYRDIWGIIPLAKHFRNSFFLGMGEVLVVMVLGIPAAYSLSRFRFAGRQPYMVFLLITQMFPAVVVILGVFRVVAALGIVDNLATVAVVAAAFNLAFCIWLLTGYFSGIPPEIEEAAMMDGNSRLGAMIRMTLPLSWPGLVAVAIFAFMDGWNEFLFSLTFIRTDEFLPLTVGLFRFITRFQIQWHHLMAGSFLATVVVVVLFMMVQDKLTRGLVSMSEK